MAVYVVGDVHGAFWKFKWLEQHVQPEDTVIQVGDFGFYPEVIKQWMQLFPAGFPCRVLAIAGNHEDYTYLEQFETGQVEKVAGNLFYVPRGHVMEIEGKLFGFLGGGESVDKAWRRFKVSWWPQERITQADVDKLVENVNGRTLDYFIGHTPPLHVIRANWPKLDPRDWNLPMDWKDESSMMMDVAVVSVKFKQMYCGHMHRRVNHDNVCVLDIDEVIPL